MSRTWKRMEILVLAACLAAAVAIAGTASAQSSQSNRDDDRQSASNTNESNRGDSSNDEKRDRQESRNQDDQQTRDSERDQQDRRDSRGDRDRNDNNTPQTSRDANRQAPEMTGRQWSQDSRSQDQGGLGVSIADDDRGVRVLRVYRNTPADEMGLRQGDVITHVDGRQIRSTRDFIARIREMQPGEDVELDVTRNRDQRSLSGELESRAEALPRGVQDRQGRQTSYGESFVRSYSSPQSGRSGDALNRVYALERQLDQLRREIQQLKSSLQQRSDSDFGRSSNRRLNVSYEDGSRSDARGYPTRQTQYEDSTPQGTAYPSDESREINQDQSPGGETGEDRLHPGVNQRNEW